MSRCYAPSRHPGPTPQHTHWMAMFDPTRSLIPYAVLILALIASTPVWGGPSGSVSHPDTLRDGHSAKAAKGKGGKGAKGKAGKGKGGKGGKTGKGGKGKKNNLVGPFK